MPTNILPIFMRTSIVLLLSLLAGSILPLPAAARTLLDGGGIDDETKEGGIVIPTIVHGVVASIGQFPYLGHLQIESFCDFSEYIYSKASSRKSGNFVECGSSLILPRVIVTAGHCPVRCDAYAQDGTFRGETITSHNSAYTWSSPVIVGLNVFNKTKDTEPGNEERTISTIVRHPDYEIDSDGSPAKNDISLMSFKVPSAVTPVQVSTDRNYPSTGTPFTVAGWGHVNSEISTPMSDVVRTAVVPAVPLAQCSAVYKNQIWSGAICAGANPANYADTCQGDSGGPLLYNGQEDPTAHRLGGLTSYGYGCANKYPGVYTNVAKQLAWMDDTVILNNMGGVSVPKVGCTSYEGQAYKSARNTTVRGIKSAGECCNACKVSFSCRSWSWSAAGRECALLDGVARRQIAVGWTSGNLTGLPSMQQGKQTTQRATGECELEYYVTYNNAGRTQSVANITSGVEAESAVGCCGACKANEECVNFTWNLAHKECLLFQGPSPRVGWGRSAWQYNYISGLVVRK